MKLILHIGTEKTGTTAIQKFLTSKKNLEKLQLWTSRSQGLGNHSYYAAYAFDTSSRDVAMTMRKLQNDKEKHSQFRRLIERSLLRDIADSRASDFVITSEDLSRVFQPHEIARLSTFLSAHFDEIQIVLFVRRQDEVAISRHGMFIRDGIGQRFSFESITDRTRHKFYNYSNIYLLWREQFPDAEITVVPYGANSRNGGRDSIELFLEAIGRRTDIYTQSLRANTSISSARYRFFQILRNRGLTKLSYKKASPLLKALNLDELDNVVPASKNSANEFLNWFAASNLLLAAELGKGHLFHDDTTFYQEDFDWEAFDEDILSRVPKDIVARFQCPEDTKG